MKWQNGRQSDNIEDRRSSGGMQNSLGGVGMLVPLIRFLLGSNIGRVVLLVGVVAYFMGYNPLALLDGSSAQSPQNTAQISEKSNEKAKFVSAVLAQTEDVWSKIFSAYGVTYAKPKLVLFTGAVKSGCGFASSQTGPFYCPADQKVYIDLGFFDELETKYKAAGDFAEAYVIAHEIGHHVQNLLGTLGKINQLKSQTNSEAERNALQVKVELQADCYGGVWGHYMNEYKILDHGDLEEALNAASAIGDDTLQRRHQGYVVPDSFTHGSSKERVQWFKKGFDSGNIKACVF